MANLKKISAIFQITGRCVEQKIHPLSSRTRCPNLYKQKHEKGRFTSSCRTIFMGVSGENTNEHSQNKQGESYQTGTTKLTSTAMEQKKTSSDSDKLESSSNIQNKKLGAIIHKSASLVVSEEVLTAHAEGKPVVALESAIITHGMPSPDNLSVAMKLETTIREKRDNLKRCLARIQLVSPSPDVCVEARRLLLYLQQFPQYSAGNFFELSKAQLVRMSGFIATYVVILLQFNGETEPILDRLAKTNVSAETMFS